MGDGWISGIVAAPWAPAAAAYVFGIITGWLIWSGRRAKDAATADSEALPAGNAPKEPRAPIIAKAEGEEIKNGGDPCPAVMKLGAVESEIRSARELLDESEEEARAFSQELSTLDSAIRRANGRLKLILRAVRRATSDR
jgi:hypothetical protein